MIDYPERKRVVIKRLEKVGVLLGILHDTRRNDILGVLELDDGTFRTAYLQDIKIIKSQRIKK